MPLPPRMDPSIIQCLPQNSAVTFVSHLYRIVENCRKLLNFVIFCIQWYCRSDILYFLTMWSYIIIVTIALHSACPWFGHSSNSLSFIYLFIDQIESITLMHNLYLHFILCSKREDIFLFIRNVWRLEKI